MRWQQMLGSAVVVVGTASLGCKSSLPLHPTGGLSSSALVRAADGPAVRSQKPEAEDVVPASAPSPVSGQVVASIRAWVNGKPILDSEVREAAIGGMRELLRVDVAERAREERKLLDGALDQIIDRELLYNDAMEKLRRANKRDVYEKIKEAADRDFQRWLGTVKKAFPSDAEFKQYLQAMGTSFEAQRRQRERMFIAEEYLRSTVMRYVERAAAPQEILDYYKGHPEEFRRTDSVQWQDIFVLAGKFPTRDDARRFAENLAARARAGEDFVALCRQHDDGLAKDQQGMGLGSERGKVRPPEVEPVVFALKPGEVGPVVELPGGFHVVKVIRREYEGVLPFDEKVQTTVREKMRNEVYQKERKRFVEELRRNAQIEKVGK